MARNYRYETEENEPRDGAGETSNKLTYLLIGSGIGAALALLFAPKSGRELRDDIADVTRKGYDKSLDTAQQLKVQAGDYYGQVKSKTGDYYGQVKSQAGDFTNKVGEAYRTGINTRSATETQTKSVGEIGGGEEKRAEIGVIGEPHAAVGTDKSDI